MQTIYEVSDYLKSLAAQIPELKAAFAVSTSETREITIENGDFTLFRTLFDRSVTMKVIKDQKQGATKMNSFDEAAIKESFDTVLASAEAGTAEEFYDIAPGLEPAEFTIGVYEPDIDKLMQRSREFSDAIAAQFPKILLMQLIIKHTKTHTIYTNTNGTKDDTYSGAYTVMAEFAGNDGTNSTGICGTDFEIANLDVPFMDCASVRKDLEDAQNSLNPITISGKFEGDVIFTPGGAAQLFYYSLINFIGDSVLIDGTALWKDKIGEKVASDLVTINLCPWDDRVVTHEVHTDDGFRSENCSLIENGVLQTTLASLYTANKCKVDRVKNSGFNVILTPGTTSLQDMIAGVKKGLIVGSLSCGSPSANGEVSGVAKNSFYVEDGKIVGAVSETMVSCNLADVMKNIKAVSSESVCDGSTVLSYVQADHITISGK